MFSFPYINTDKGKTSQRFYSKLAFENLFGIRELRNQIEKKVYERIENADIQLYGSKVIEKGVFKDSYLFDFLEIKDGYLKNDLVAEILKELELFIFELRNDFSFVERQNG